MTDFVKISDKTLYTAADTARVKAVVGGKNTEYFAPSINVSVEFESREEQAFFNICDDPGQFDTSECTETHDGNKLSVASGDVESNFVLSDYSVKINRVFNSMPTETPRYKLAYSDGVEFYYQGELTDSEIAEGCSRPDNVIGSYAVYCKKSGHYKDKDGNTIVNYGTGKIGHLYAPYWTDGAGRIVKGTQEIINGYLVFALPDQEWLDAATLPITLDPDVGYTTIGASLGNWSAGYVVLLQSYSTASSPGIADSISMHCSISSVTNAKFALYSDVSGAAARVGGITDEVTIPAATPAWHTAEYLSDNPEITTATQYYIAQNHTTTNLSISYDSMPGLSFFKAAKYSADPLPISLSSLSTGYTGRAWSAYVTYTAGSSQLPINCNLLAAAAQATRIIQ